MKRYYAFLMIAFFAGTMSLQAQANPISADAKQGYESIKNILLKSADKMPEADYSFRTTPKVRTYGEMIAHIADTQTMLCSMAQGGMKKGTAASKTSKADLVEALKASFAECDPVYDNMTDAAGVEMVKVMGRNMTKLGLLNFNVTHDNEMYGIIGAFLRIKGIVPPSSEGRP